MRSPEDVAEILADLYGAEFSGKSKGRYRISRKDLSAISGRVVLKQSVINEIIDTLATNHDLVMIDLVTDFPVIQASILMSYRNVTSKIVKEVSRDKAPKK